MTLISPSLYEGGDSEWFINYLRPIIRRICEQSVFKFLKKREKYKEKRKNCGKRYGQKREESVK